jgi:ATP-dependent Lon protease
MNIHLAPPSLVRLQEILENTSIALLQHQRNQLLDAATASFVMKQLEEINEAISGTPEDRIFVVVDSLGSFVQKYGTLYVEDFVYLFSWKHNRIPPPEEKLLDDRVRILRRHFRPFQSKLVPTATLVRQEGLSGPPVLYQCLPPEPKQHYYFRTHGCRLLLDSGIPDKTLVLYGVLDEVLLPQFLFPQFLFQTKMAVLEQADKEGFPVSAVEDMMRGFHLADALLFPLSSSSTFDPTVFLNNTTPLHAPVVQPVLRSWFDKVDQMEQFILKNKFETVVAKFNELSIFDKIQFFRFLLLSKNFEIHYTTYLLYDLLSLVGQKGEPAIEPCPALLSSLPLALRRKLKHSVHESIRASQQWSMPSESRHLTLEQQVFMMRAPDKVKDKALSKLKEIKAKSDELTSKSHQYLEGLLRIPFGYTREEPILTQGRQIKDRFHALFPGTESLQDLSSMNQYLQNNVQALVEKRSSPAFWQSTPVRSLKHGFPDVPPRLSKAELCNWYADRFANGSWQSYASDSGKKGEADKKGEALTDPDWENTQQLTNHIQRVGSDLKEVENILDASVYGHREAKRKIVQVVGQWLSSPDKKQGGYAFGFEGEPGIGKTSLANLGLSQCLKDENGVPRPFHIIALGGSCNSSTLEGHNYTYSNSTWGRIVDILMESKCMNPIIYIDELDKVSKTENGKEIIGILIHIIDSSTNAGFQDKYFSGIDIDLSQVLFVFSYNRPEDIDKILLDRIHRIPFDSLTVADKVVIVRKYIIPSLESKMGLAPGLVQISDATIQYLIENYTVESGIRKTKQLLFDVYSQINLRLISCQATVPVILTEDILDNDYLKTAIQVVPDRIHGRPEVGVMNALYATQSGNGGIIRIETRFFPSDRLLDMKLTGSLGKVFTESMDICKNLAWNMLSTEEQAGWMARFAVSKQQGIHVHFGDCNTPKEGASASLASALTIYSLLVNKPLRNDMAMTGETNLSGDAKRIGGIDQKFLGGIRAGIRLFFYPEENQQEVDQFLAKTQVAALEGSQFFAVASLAQVIDHPVGIFTGGV